jgi:hypothetical protein
MAADRPADPPHPQRAIAAVLGRRLPQAANAVYLAPKQIYPRRDEAVQPTEIEIAGRTSIRCKDLA